MAATTCWRCGATDTEQMKVPMRDKPGWQWECVHYLACLSSRFETTLEHSKQKDGADQ